MAAHVRPAPPLCRTAEEATYNENPHTSILTQRMEPSARRAHSVHSLLCMMLDFAYVRTQALYTAGITPRALCQ